MLWRQKCYKLYLVNDYESDFFLFFFSNRFNCFLFPPSCKIKVSPFLSTKKMCMNFLIAVCFAIACLALYPMNQVYMLTYDDINHLGSKFKLLSLISVGRYFIYLMVSMNSVLLYITITWEGACAFSILILELFFFLNIDICGKT